METMNLNKKENVVKFYLQDCFWTASTSSDQSIALEQKCLSWDNL